MENNLITRIRFLPPTDEESKCMVEIEICHLHTIKDIKIGYDYSITWPCDYKELGIDSYTKRRYEGEILELYEAWRYRQDLGQRQAMSKLWSRKKKSNIRHEAAVRLPPLGGEKADE